MNNSIIQYIFQKKLIKFFLLGLLILSQIACKKLAETPIPTDQVAENAVYTNDATAISALTALYIGMNSDPIQGTQQNNLGNISIDAGLAADEFSVTSPFISGGGNTFMNYYQNNLSQTNSAAVSGGEHWAPFYQFIFNCNAAVTGLTSSNANSLTPTIRQQLIGEAKFMRAFFYFYLVNEFGDVPLVLTTDPQINTSLPRSPKDNIYNQIKSDLIDAKDKLSSNYLDITLLTTTTERVRPTKWAAAALLARVYLYTKEYDKAIAQSTLVINNTTLYGSLPPLNSVFLKNSREAIWQIQPTALNYNTLEGQGYVIPTTGPSNGNGVINPAYLSQQLLNSFEINDQRKVKGNWVDTVIYQSSTNPVKYDTLPYVAKYKVATSSATTVGGLTEYFMVLRLAEQYLIRAEARAYSDPTGAVSDLNVVRNRAGLAAYAGSTAQAPLVSAILHERQVELFGEWGHRWFDLKRTGNIDVVMSSVTPLKANGVQWQSYQQLYPIPLEALQSSPHLTQNSGY